MLVDDNREALKVVNNDWYYIILQYIIRAVDWIAVDESVSSVERLPSPVSSDISTFPFVASFQKNWFSN